MQAYKIIAKNSKTRQRIQQQYLNGYLVTDYTEALRLAQDLAEKQSRRSGETWTAVVETFETSRRDS
jgi:hypothetical protein